MEWIHTRSRLLVCGALATVVAAVVGPMVGSTRPVFYIGTFVVATLALVVVDGVVSFSRGVRWSIIAIIYSNLILSMTPYERDELYSFRLLGSRELRLDNLMHGVAAAVAALAVCEICLVFIGTPKARWGLAVVSALAALGLGSLKELADIVTAWVDSEELIWSTGRDLLWNTLGAAAAGIAIVVVGATTPKRDSRPVQTSPSGSGHT